MPCEVPSTPYMVFQDMSYIHLRFSLMFLKFVIERLH